jgi:hypothetical protein
MLALLKNAEGAAGSLSLTFWGVVLGEFVIKA